MEKEYRKRRASYLEVDDLSKLVKYGIDINNLKRAQVRIIEFNNDDATFSQRFDMLLTLNNGTTIYSKYRIFKQQDEMNIRDEFRGIPTIYK